MATFVSESFWLCINTPHWVNLKLGGVKSGECVSKLKNLRLEGSSWEMGMLNFKLTGAKFKGWRTKLGIWLGEVGGGKTWNWVGPSWDVWWLNPVTYCIGGFKYLHVADLQARIYGNSAGLMVLFMDFVVHSSCYCIGVFKDTCVIEASCVLECSLQNSGFA